MNQLLNQVRSCTTCVPHLPLGPNPVLSLTESSKVLIIGQAPGVKVHESGIPWADKSGDNLRRWLGVKETEFYNPDLFGILPMGFCYPGKGKSGDLPPRKECAPLWHGLLMDHLKSIQLTLLIGQYAQKYYLKDQLKSNLTTTVKNFEAYLPDYFVLPHPSPRNNIWKKKNPWFEEKVIPRLQDRVNQVLERY